MCVCAAAIVGIDELCRFSSSVKCSGWDDAMYVRICDHARSHIRMRMGQRVNERTDDRTRVLPFIWSFRRINQVRDCHCQFFPVIHLNDAQILLLSLFTHLSSTSLTHILQSSPYMYGHIVRSGVCDAFLCLPSRKKVQNKNIQWMRLSCSSILLKYFLCNLTLICACFKGFKQKTS